MKRLHFSGMFHVSAACNGTVGMAAYFGLQLQSIVSTHLLMYTPGYTTASVSAAVALRVDFAGMHAFDVAFGSTITTTFIAAWSREYLSREWPTMQNLFGSIFLDDINILGVLPTAVAGILRM